MGNKFRELRKKNDYSQAGLAELLGCGITAVQNWEAGRNLPNGDMAKKLADEYQCSLDYLYLGVENPATEDLKHITEKEKAVILQGLDKLAGKDRGLYERQINFFLRMKEGLDLIEWEG